MINAERLPATKLFKTMQGTTQHLLHLSLIKFIHFAYIGVAPLDHTHAAGGVTLMLAKSIKLDLHVSCMTLILLCKQYNIDYCFFVNRVHKNWFCKLSLKIPQYSIVTLVNSLNRIIVNSLIANGIDADYESYEPWLWNKTLEYYRANSADQELCVDIVKPWW